MLKKIDLKALIKISAIFVVIFMAFYLYNHYEIQKLISRENIELYLKPFGPWIPVAFLIIFTLAMIFYLPASVFMITIGTLLGPFWGSFWGMLGCNLASIIIFFGARKIGLKTVKNKLGDKWEKFNLRIEEDGFLYVALIRSSLLLPFGVVCYGSAITSIRTRDYINGSLVGSFPLILIFCYIVPMVISQSLTIKNIVILIITTLLWLLTFGLVYHLHKKAKKNFQGIITD